MKPLFLCLLFLASAVAQLPPPAPGKAHLVFYRPKYAVIASSLDSGLVWIDGREIVRLESRQFVVVEMPPGRHQVSSEAKNFAIGVTLEAGQTYYFREDYDMAGWKGSQVLVAVDPESAELQMAKFKPARRSNIFTPELLVVPR
jgi:hypothetical protein